MTRWFVVFAMNLFKLAIASFEKEEAGNTELPSLNITMNGVGKNCYIKKIVP